MGCQAFIVLHEQALWSFLDLFMEVHDLSNQRSFNKKFIVVLKTLDPDSKQKICEHPAIRDLQEILIIILNEEYEEPFELYTTNIFGNGSRGVTVVQIRPITGSDYFPDKSKNLQQIPLKFSTMWYPPYISFEETTPDMANARYDSAYKVQDAPVLIDGTDACVVVEFCRLRNCSLELFDDEIETWGDVFENRTGTGIMGAVASRNAHFAAAAIYYWLGPCHWTSYTTQITRAAVTVLVPRPLQLAPWKTPFLSFTGVLWIAVGVAFTVGVFAVWLVENGRARILNLPKAQAKSFSDSVLTLIGFYMEQSSSTRTDLVCCIFLFTSLIIAGFMIGNMYGAGLAGVMTIPQYERPIDTTVDLANSGLLFAGTVINWIYCILESTEPHLITLGDNYRVLDTEHLMKHSKTRDMGFVGEFTEFGHFTPVDFLDAESASMLRILKDDLAWQSTTILMTKTCPFRQSFSDLVMNVRQSGIQHLIEYRVN
ncbi:uncharacterized protein LOC131684630 isoform X1 [Topomyia yanbarensis]|uniref:uncharacterized protein LOC131684630 isoform X1 n=1 Tax=Topomyia yanbarensis TaxID=2498891 RepID=UPI00273BD5C4|nr:uncharacterized protein LOC131684630 isoform X1 [Topomyia yanbarensis]